MQHKVRFSTTCLYQLYVWAFQLLSVPIHLQIISYLVLKLLSFEHYNLIRLLSKPWQCIPNPNQSLWNDTLIRLYWVLLWYLSFCDPCFQFYHYWHAFWANKNNLLEELSRLGRKRWRELDEWCFRSWPLFQSEEVPQSEISSVHFPPQCPTQWILPIVYLLLKIPASAESFCLPSCFLIP